MDTITMLLAAIGVMLIYVLYLQIRLSATSRPTYVVVPPAAEDQSGCGAPVVAILLILAVLVSIAFFGFPPIF